MTKLEGNYHMFLDQKHQFVCYMVCKLYNIYCTDDDNNKKSHRHDQYLYWVFHGWKL